MCSWCCETFCCFLLRFRGFCSRKNTSPPSSWSLSRSNSNPSRNNENLNIRRQRALERARAHSLSWCGKHNKSRSRNEGHTLDDISPPSRLPIPTNGTTSTPSRTSSLPAAAANTPYAAYVPSSPHLSASESHPLQAANRAKPLPPLTPIYQRGGQPPSPYTSPHSPNPQHTTYRPFTRAAASPRLLPAQGSPRAPRHRESMPSAVLTYVPMLPAANEFSAVAEE